MTEWVHFLCCQISAWFSNTREAHDSGWHGTTLYYPPPVGNGTILGARSNMKNTRWLRKKVAFWMFCIWYGGGFRGDHFRSQKLYCRLNWRQWFRRKQILEFSVYSQVRMEIGWTTHNFENGRLPRMRSIGPSLSTLLKCTMAACSTCVKQHDCILDAQYILCHKTLCLKCTPSPSSTEPAHYVESSKCSTHTACTQMCDV